MTDWLTVNGKWLSADAAVAVAVARRPLLPQWSMGQSYRAVSVVETVVRTLGALLNASWPANDLKMLDKERKKQKGKKEKEKNWKLAS